MIIIGMGMGFVAAPHIGMVLVAALIRRHTHITFRQFPLNEHGVIAIVTAVIVGIGLNGNDRITLYLVDNTHMVKILHEQQVTGQRRIFCSAVTGDIEALGISRRGPGTFFQDVCGDIRLLRAPADKHGTPRLFRVSVPISVLGIIFKDFGISDLGQGNTDQVLPLVSRIHVCIGIDIHHIFRRRCRKRRCRSSQKQSRQYQYGNHFFDHKSNSFIW